MHNVGEAKPFDDIDDLLGCCGLAADDLPPVAARAKALRNRQPDGFQRREVEEQLIDLEGARHAQSDAVVRLKRGNVGAVEQNVAGGRPH